MDVTFCSTYNFQKMFRIYTNKDISFYMYIYIVFIVIKFIFIMPDKVFVNNIFFRFFQLFPFIVANFTSFCSSFLADVGNIWEIMFALLSSFKNAQLTWMKRLKMMTLLVMMMLMTVSLLLFTFVVLVVFHLRVVF